jgi:predicted kinase
LSYGLVNGWFHDELIKIQQTHPDLIAGDLDVIEAYNIYRSLRRGATSRATALKYDETVINLNNRWRTTQSNKGKGGLVKMSQLYVEVSLVLDGLLEFSISL